MSDAEYSPEDKALVDRVLREKDFYNILGVTKETNEDTLKKAYRKLSLKVHPDKNKAPKAEECFKKVSAAYDILSNKEKRERYDLGGGDDLFATEQSARQGGGGFQTGDGFTYYYSGNIDPNDIFFNFFSGGGFEEAFGMNNDQFRRRYNNRGPRNRQHHQQQPRNNFVAMLIQFFPIIVILSYLLMNPLFMKTQYYSFNRTNRFPHRKVSKN